jgi:hypothetical protein
MLSRPRREGVRSSQLHTDHHQKETVVGLFGKKKSAPVGTVKTKSNGQLDPGRSLGFACCGCGETYELRDSENVPVSNCPSCGQPRC